MIYLKETHNSTYYVMQIKLRHIISTAHLLVFSVAFPFVVSCHQESLDDKAERDAEEYNRKFCPTPVINFSRTDSVKYDRATRTYTYYCSLVDQADNEELIRENYDVISSSLMKNISESTTMKPYLDAGIKFKFICRSGSNPKKILLETK